MREFLDEVKEQGRALRAVTEAFRGPEAGLLGAAARIVGGRPIALCGMGSSYAAALAVEAFLASRGRLAFAVDAAEALYRWVPVLDRPDGAVPVLISQSGESQEMVRLADRLSSPFIAITNVPGSTLGKRAAVALPLHAGRERGVTNKTFLNTIAVGLFFGRAVMADGSGDNLSEMARLIEAAEFLQAASAVDGLVSRSEGPIRDLLAHLAGGETAVPGAGDGTPPPAWEIVGRGSAMAAVSQASLVLRELTGRLVAAFAGGFYRHGPVYRTGPWTRVIILASQDEEGNLLARLAGEILDRGGRIAFISDFDPGIESPLFRRFPVPPAGRCLFPILAMVPLELLGAEDASRRGFDPYAGVPKVTPVE